jgi:hypothetical protein
MGMNGRALFSSDAPEPIDARHGVSDSHCHKAGIGLCCLLLLLCDKRQTPSLEDLLHRQLPPCRRRLCWIEQGDEAQQRLLNRVPIVIQHVSKP